MLFVIADEWRYVSTGYGGDSNVRTPALDAFARESIDCHNAVAGCAVCCPSRASIMTGQFPLTDGVYINDVHLAPQDQTLAQAFAAAGYQTGYVGKWHLYGSPDGADGRRLVYIPKDERLGFEYWKACECTHDYNRSLYFDGDDPTPRYWKGYDASAETDDVCQFIHQRANQDKPFFMFLSWGPPHFPLDSAPAEEKAQFASAQIELRPNVPQNLAPRAETELRGYYAHMAALDKCFAHLLKTLKDEGIADDTIVIFTSDHGDMMYSQGMEFKVMPWEESLRIPFLIRYPEKFGPKGRKSEVLLNTPDIMPSLLGLCGIPVPAGVQGNDYSGSEFSDDPHAKIGAFLSMPVTFANATWSGLAEYRGVRTSRYTYVRAITGPWLLYDNQADPFQKHNLLGQASSRQVQAELEADLKTWLERLHDDFRTSAFYLSRDKLQNYLEIQVPSRHLRSPWGDWESTLAANPTTLCSRSPLSDLWGNPRANAILLKIFPALHPTPVTYPFYCWCSVKLLERYLPGVINDGKIKLLDDQLAALR